MNAVPRITIVTPSYNQAAFLERTLRSVHDQHYPNLQHIVVDGGSTDGSVDLLRRYSDHLSAWISEPDDGQADAINKGFARADGEIMTWLNSDDVLLPGALHRTAQTFARYPQIQWMTGQPSNIDAEDQPFGTTLAAGCFRPLIRHGWYHGRGLGFIRQEGTFWRRSLWNAAGGRLDTHLRYAMDFDLWRRFAVHADLVAADVKLAAFRVHAAQKTADLAPYYAEAGVTLPPWFRAVALPVRVVVSLLSRQLAPRVRFTPDDTPIFMPGPFFRGETD